MNNIGFEYYYLSGKDIVLSKYDLGSIRQLTLNNFIELGIDINDFVQPFLLNKNIMLNKNKDVDKLLNELKDLSFLFLYEQLTKKPIISFLLKSLSIIYKSTNLYVDKDSIAIIIESGIDNKTYTINDDNFEMLSTVVCEMMGIDRTEIVNIEPPKEMTDIELEFERRRKKYEEMQKGKKAKKTEGYTLLDIANIIIHSSGLTYDEVFNMTIYQLKNSFRVLIRKDNYMVNLLHRISQKFDTSKEKFVHWTDEIKLEVSSLNVES